MARFHELGAAVGIDTNHPASGFHGLVGYVVRINDEWIDVEVDWPDGKTEVLGVLREYLYILDVD